MSETLVSDAESHVNALVTEHEAAARVAALAETAVTTAANALTRARELVTGASAELAAATEAATEAETAWTADPSPSRWAKVSTARAARDQVDVRLRALCTAHDRAATEHAATEQRAAAARRDLAALAVSLQRARDVLTARRANAAAVDEESASRAGAKLREAEAIERERVELVAGFEREAVPLLEAYAEGALAMNRALVALSAVVRERQAQAAALTTRGLRAGVFEVPPRDLALKMDAPMLAAVTAGMALSEHDPVHKFVMESRVFDMKGRDRCKPTEARTVAAACARFVLPRLGV